MIRVASREQIPRSLESVSVFEEARSFFSTLEKEVPGDIDLATLRSPRELDGLELAIVEGEFGVAENAAVWVDAQHLKQRAVLFLAEHLILVVSADEMVHNMSDAYRRLSFPSASFGLFISGPSKTADIEQSLVIGAQGPRSLLVLLIG